MSSSFICACGVVCWVLVFVMLSQVSFLILQSFAEKEKAGCCHCGHMAGLPNGGMDGAAVCGCGNTCTLDMNI